MVFLIFIIMSWAQGNMVQLQLEPNQSCRRSMWKMDYVHAYQKLGLLVGRTNHKWDQRGIILSCILQQTRCLHQAITHKFVHLYSSTSPSSSTFFSSSPKHWYALTYHVLVHQDRLVHTILADCRNRSGTRGGKPCWQPSNT